MSAIDSWLEGFMHGASGVGLVLLVSLLLGLRHATDPDHLAAVTTLIASENRNQARKASVIGLFWGLGHGTTLVLVGLPLVLLGRYLPEIVQQTAEVTLGGIIMLLGARLLLRWRRGLFHAHAHRHDGTTPPPPRPLARSLPRARSRPHRSPPHALLLLRDRARARHRRLGGTYVAFALDHLEPNRSDGCSPALRRRDGRLDDAPLDRLRARHSRRLDRAQLRAGGAGLWGHERGLRCVVRVWSAGGCGLSVLGRVLQR